MSQHKTAPETDFHPSSKYQSQLTTLKNCFADWENDDLHSLLTEVNGDVNLAATRIAEGQVQQWGSVSRKKDKKATPTPSTKDGPPPRGESRGSRGGRGGRGGSGRGGATARGRGGPPRAPAVNGHTRTASPRPARAGGAFHPASAPSAQPETSDMSKSSTEVTWGQNDWGQNGVSTAWTDHKPVHTEASDTTISPEPVPVDTLAPTLINNLPTNQAPKVPSSAPGSTKLSWAQIASKPTHKTGLPPPPQQPISASSQQRLTPSSAPAATEEPEPEPQPTGWEEPTTVQPPSWEPEPSQASPAVDLPVEESKSPEVIVPSIVPEKSEEPQQLSAPPPESVVDSTPAKVEPPSQTSGPPLPTPALPSSAAATPSPKLVSRTAVLSSRASARNRTTDQPVVMPSSFGSVEKIGMQFGSLSLNGESLFEASANELETPAAPAPAPAPAPVPETTTVATTPNKSQPPASSIPPATAPATSTSLGSVFQHQQQQTQSTHTAQPQPQTQQPAAGTQFIAHQPLSTSVSQPTQTTQPSTHTSAVTASPLQPYTHQPQGQAQQPSLATLQQQQQQSQQNNHQHPSQQNNHQHPQHHGLPQQAHTHQYSQHLPAQLESQQQHLPSTTQQQPPSATAHSSYFRQNENSNATPYFHTPTPPAGQTQDATYPGFNQLGGQNQLQQGSHLGGFGSTDYSYETARNVYDAYAQQSNFGNRNMLGGHEEIKGLPGNQQQPQASALPPSAAQSSQHSSQSTNQPQSAGGQGPQQFGHPLSFYYPYATGSQFFGVPYGSAYPPQPYVKYTPMFPPGPPGTSSAPSPAAKQPGSNMNVAQPSNNPYPTALYQQPAYDDYSQHPQHPQQQHAHALGLGQTGVGLGGANEYGKPLYGGAGQGFVGLSGQTGGAGSGVSGAGSGPRNASSPETPFKYQKDGGIGVGGGRGGSVQAGPGQGQGPGQGGQGGPQGQGYYSANRFGGAGAGIGGGVGPQQNAHHQQGGPPYQTDGSFYPYQTRYWQ